MKPDNYKPFSRPIPLLEVALSLFSLYVVIMLFLQPTLIVDAESGIFFRLNKIMPQPYWAICFMVAALTKVLGLLLKKDVIRMIGLGMSCVLYTAVTVASAFDFPNFNFGIFGVFAVMALISIFYVRITEL